MGQPVVHWEIAGRDTANLQAFYRQLFGWKITAADAMDYGFVETGGEGGIDGGIFRAPDGTTPHVTFYVEVNDLGEYLAKANRLGAQTSMPPTPMPGIGAAAMFTDPEGNTIGLFTGQTVS
ncbi:MAG: VOC family protein [SAR202 cluster bacterium]|jgi:hypothetical protein|nr:VOC family protein [SAR202 cluster bacterium]MDP6300957.1 VOC family protein [SAR202 cluster bacterium]MDP7223804.1 VOC family protein [SAR202 cluster bacterium]MDP7412895.1 VOC family protein [SAR202 cluster bacterium]